MTDPTLPTWKTDSARIGRRPLSRRGLLRKALLGAGAMSVGAGLYANVIEPHWVEVVHHKVALPRLGEDLDGYQIVHVSDLHTCAAVSTAYLARCMELINGIGADLIVVTGDLITGGLRDEIPTVADLLARLQATDGLLVALGNNDYSGWTPETIRLDVADRLTEAIRQVGTKVLRNQNMVVSRARSAITVVGLDDLSVGRCLPELAFEGVTTDHPIVALVHNPDSIQLLRDGPADLLLMGHTHGGQVWIPLLGPPQLPIRNRRFAAGAIRVGRQLAYVSRGLGHLMKVRFNCRPEITVHHLHRQEA